jgi:cell division protein FtsW
VNDQKNHIDLPLLFCVLTLMALSIGVVYSASAAWSLRRYGESDYLLNSHAFKIMLGVIALFIGMSIRYRVYQKVTKPTLLIALAILVVTLLMGGEVKGATRWLRMGSIGFQPSEFAKFALVFHLCTLVVTKGETIRNFERGFLPMIVWIGSISALVLLQPNFSTGSLILLISFLILFMSRAKLVHLIATMVAGIVCLLLLALMKPHVMERLAGFGGLLGGGSTGGETNYQLWQGIIGFGNGGLFGVGPGESKQRDFFLPESYGDFVFSIVGEEYGFIGTITFLTLFVVIMMRGFKIARFARDGFGYFLAVGITSTIALYALVNAGVALGVLPTTGLPMPFVSYGGSSIVFSAFAVGVLLNISAYTDLHPRMVKIPVVGSVDATNGMVEFAEQSPGINA